MDSEEQSARQDESSASDERHRKLLRDHPLEESQKSYHTALEQEILEAEEELERPASALLLSGLTAGLDLGFGPFAMAVGIMALAAQRARSPPCTPTQRRREWPRSPEEVRILADWQSSCASDP